MTALHAVHLQRKHASTRAVVSRQPSRQPSRQAITHCHTSMTMSCRQIEQRQYSSALLLLQNSMQGREAGRSDQKEEAVSANQHSQRTKFIPAPPQKLRIPSCLLSARGAAAAASRQQQQAVFRAANHANAHHDSLPAAAAAVAAVAVVAAATTKRRCVPLVSQCLCACVRVRVCACAPVCVLFCFVSELISRRS
jgi:hypothetical protein